MEQFNNNILQLHFIYKRIIIAVLLMVIAISWIYLCGQPYFVRQISKPKEKNIVKPIPIYLGTTKGNRTMSERTDLGIKISSQVTGDNIRAVLANFKMLFVAIKQYGGFLNFKEAKNLLTEAMQIYDLEMLGIKDYILQSVGGYIISTPNTTSFLIYEVKVFGFISVNLYWPVRNIIDIDVSPNKRYCFIGSWGRIHIKIAKKIFITAVTMEHTHNTTEESLTAPKNFIVFGFKNLVNNTLVGLGMFKYSTQGSSRQTFLMQTENQTVPFEYIELNILDNHGNPNITCLHRFRVHGRPQ